MKKSFDVDLFFLCHAPPQKAGERKKEKAKMPFFS